MDVESFIIVGIRDELVAAGYECVYSEMDDWCCSVFFRNSAGNWRDDYTMEIWEGMVYVLDSWRDVVLIIDLGDRELMVKIFEFLDKKKRGV